MARSKSIPRKVLAQVAFGVMSAEVAWKGKREFHIETSIMI